MEEVAVLMSILAAAVVEHRLAMTDTVMVNIVPYLYGHY